jgi:hypothetical protein
VNHLGYAFRGEVCWVTGLELERVVSPWPPRLGFLAACQLYKSHVTVDAEEGRFAGALAIKEDLPWHLTTIPSSGRLS